MLVLSRKEGEVVNIGDGISIQVLTIRHGKVRLGLTAPAEFRVTRPDAKCKEPKQEKSDAVQSR